MVLLWRASRRTDRSVLVDWSVRDRDQWRHESPPCAQQGLIIAAIRDQRLYELPRPRHLHHHRSRQHQCGGGSSCASRTKPLDDDRGLGTMGYGFSGRTRASAHREAWSSISPATLPDPMGKFRNVLRLAYSYPVQDHHLNNQYMGMCAMPAIAARQPSCRAFPYTMSMPIVVKLARPMAQRASRCTSLHADLDYAISRYRHARTGDLRCRLAALAKLLPDDPSGKAHNEMLLPDEATDEAVANAIDAKGRALV